MAFKFEHIENYLIITNTISGYVELEYPTKDIFYRNSPNAIHIEFKFDRSTMFSCQKSDIVDVDGNAFTDSELLTFLRRYTGTVTPYDEVTTTSDDGTVTHNSETVTHT